MSPTRSGPHRARRTGQLPAHKRGLGYQHRARRARLLAALVEGTPCWWCGHGMYRTQDLAADHTQARAHGGTGADRLLHLPCNAARQDGSHDDRRPAVTGAPCGCPIGLAGRTRGETPRRSRAW